MTSILFLNGNAKTAQKGLKIELIISMPKSYAPRFLSPSGPQRINEKTGIISKKGGESFNPTTHRG
jgi:hypothetical protein